MGKYLRIFLVPTLITKTGILYFGIHYAAEPGEGYGYGLALFMILTLSNFAYFLWLTRNEPEG